MGTQKGYTKEFLKTWMKLKRVAWKNYLPLLYRPTVKCFLCRRQLSPHKKGPKITVRCR